MNLYDPFHVVERNEKGDRNFNKVYKKTSLKKEKCGFRNIQP